LARLFLLLLLVPPLMVFSVTFYFDRTGWLVVLGVLMGGLVLALYLPVFQLGQVL
jgi:hypothetical protein